MNPTQDTHLKSIGYILWLFGFLGAHRFYYGKPISGTIYFFTLGLLGIGWIVDLFLIPRDRHLNTVAGMATWPAHETPCPALDDSAGQTAGMEFPLHSGTTHPLKGTPPTAPRPPPPARGSRLR